MFTEQESLVFRQNLRNYCEKQYIYCRLKQLNASEQIVSAALTELRTQSNPIVGSIQIIFSDYMEKYDLSNSEYLAEWIQKGNGPAEFRACFFKNYKLEFWTQETFDLYGAQMPILISTLAALGKTISDYTDLAIINKPEESALSKFFADVLTLPNGLELKNSIWQEVGTNVITDWRDEKRLGLVTVQKLQDSLVLAADLETPDFIVLINTCLKLLQTNWLMNQLLDPEDHRYFFQMLNMPTAELDQQVEQLLG